MSLSALDLALKVGQNLRLLTHRPVSRTMVSLRSCSVACSKTHKSTLPPCVPPPAVLAASAASAASAAAREAPTYPGVLSPVQASALRESEEVRSAVRDRALQAVMERIDRATDPVQALEREMRDPDFAQFADKVLEAIGASGAVADKRDRKVAAAREELARLLREAD
jgi:hypothetical protein